MSRAVFLLARPYRPLPRVCDPWALDYFLFLVVAVDSQCSSAHVSSVVVGTAIQSTHCCERKPFSLQMPARQASTPVKNASLQDEHELSPLIAAFAVSLVAINPIIKSALNADVRRNFLHMFVFLFILVLSLFKVRGVMAF